MVAVCFMPGRVIVDLLTVHVYVYVYHFVVFNQVNRIAVIQWQLKLGPMFL